MSDDLRLLLFLIPAVLLVGLILYAVLSGIARRRKAPAESEGTGRTTFVSHWLLMTAVLILMVSILFLVLSIVRGN